MLDHVLLERTAPLHCGVNVELYLLRLLIVDNLPDVDFVFGSLCEVPFLAHKVPKVGIVEVLHCLLPILDCSLHHHLLLMFSVLPLHHPHVCGGIDGTLSNSHTLLIQLVVCMGSLLLNELSGSGCESLHVHFLFDLIKLLQIQVAAARVREGA